MRLEVRVTEMESGDTMAVLNVEDCRLLGLGEMDRVRLASPVPVLAKAGRTISLTPPGTVLLSRETLRRSGLRDGDTVEVSFSAPPGSLEMVRRSMDGKRIGPDGVRAIVADVNDGHLSKLEISAWLTAVHVNGLAPDEVQELARSMMETGCSLSFERRPVFDFHSIGGVPGNKVTPIVVSIVAASGLMLPKTSSRAISSACGTSDFVEVFCDVSLNGSRLMEIAERTGGVFAWGGAMNVTPVSGRFIDVQYSLGIDPRSMMMASIMSKKLAMGAEMLVMDIPTGPRAKVKDLAEAQAYAREFIDLGRSLGMAVECAITDGSQPLGFAIGPALEARECIQALEGDPGLGTVREKACELAGMVMEMGGIRQGREEAQRILDSGEALEKFREIVVAQGGRPGLSSGDIGLGAHSRPLPSPRHGYVLDINNQQLVAIARAAGAPSDKGGGIMLHRKMGERVEAGQPLLEIYADSEVKLERACELARRLQPLSVGGMLMERTRAARVF